jgi:hypothetical protein
MPQPEHPLIINRSIPSEPRSQLGIDFSGATPRTDDMSMAAGTEEHYSAWRVEYLADAICEYLDWQNRLLASKQERRERAMRTREANRQKRGSTSQSNDRVVAVSQTEQFRLFLTNDRSSKF